MPALNKEIGCIAIIFHVTNNNIMIFGMSLLIVIAFSKRFGYTFSTFGIWNLIYGTLVAFILYKSVLFLSINTYFYKLQSQSIELNVNIELQQTALFYLF